MNELRTQVDVAIVGGGAAGLYTALVAAEQGARVALISRSPLSQSASYWAQGGLAAAIAPPDDPQLHLADTLRAGKGAVARRAARTLCDEAPERLRELERRGFEFDRTAAGELLLGLEGGHSERRVVHAGGSATGRHLTARLSELVTSHELIEVHERASALSLRVDNRRCVGLSTRVGLLMARATVLATGGAAALWARTSNPLGATGSGLKLAHDAGATLADLELLQFHPTALITSGELDGFLITEALRGEGALLLTRNGERFVDELASRDEVTRAIAAELQQSGGDHVLLDMRKVDGARFPNVVERLVQAGFDPAREPVPVAPAAHYMIGGIATDVDGRSTLPGLYAVGECSCSGAHGANRLASNSLSECFVFGRRAARAAVAEPFPTVQGESRSAQPLAPPTDETRAALWRCAGLIRNAHDLERLTADAHPLARLIAAAALRRTESRGCHVRSDFPDTDRALEGQHVVLRKGEEARLERWD